MLACEFIEQLKEENAVFQNIREYLFGVIPDKSKNVGDLATQSDDEINDYQSYQVSKNKDVANSEDRRDRNMQNVKTYNQLKSAVWNCVIDESESD